MNQAEFCKELRVHIVRKHKTQAEAAKHWGVSGSLVSKVVKGKQAPSLAMLDDMGLKCVEYSPEYVKVKP